MEHDANTPVVAFGSEIKTLSDDGESMRIGGLLVRFGTPDEHDLSPLESWRGRDYFDKETDFGFEGKSVVPTLYHHGLNPKLKDRVLSEAELSLTDDGVWMETELKAADAYERRIMELQRTGRLKLSSGIHTKKAAREKKSTSAGEICHHVTYWPIEEASLTLTPADPRTYTMELKALSELGEQEEVFAEVEPPATPEPTEAPAPELKSFVDHRDEALDAFDGFISRARDIKSLRTARKSGAPISAAMRESLLEVKARCETMIEEADAILATGEVPVVVEEPVIPEGEAKADPAEVAAAWANFVAQNVKVSGAVVAPITQE